MARHVRTLVLAMLALAGTRVHAGWFFKDKLVEAFLQPATVREASLSPDGTHLAVIGIAADDDDISTCLLLVDTDTAESHMIRRPEATADADNPGARYYMRQPISVAWMTYRWQSCDRLYRSQPCFLQAALCLCPRAQKCETGDDLTPARLRLWRDRAALNKLRQGRADATKRQRRRGCARDDDMRAPVGAAAEQGFCAGVPALLQIERRSWRTMLQDERPGRGMHLALGYIEPISRTTCRDKSRSIRCQPSRARH
jgi:hypothetical protein